MCFPLNDGLWLFYHFYIFLLLVPIIANYMFFTLTIHPFGFLCFLFAVFGPVSCLFVIAVIYSSKFSLDKIRLLRISLHVFVPQVRWKGIPESGDTWEPERHIIGEAAQQLLEEFKSRRAEEVQVSLLHSPLDVLFCKLYHNWYSERHVASCSVTARRRTG